MPRRCAIRTAVTLAAAVLLPGAAASSGGGLVPFAVVGDAIPTPLDARDGVAERGLGLMSDRRGGNCLICHKVSQSNEPFQGEIGPPLDGIGKRLSPAQIRLRIADPIRLNPATPMPSYYRVDRLVNVAPEYRGLPVLDAQQIEDIVAYLSSLKE